MVEYSDSDRAKPKTIGPSNLPLERIVRYLKDEMVSNPFEIQTDMDRYRCAAVLLPLVVVGDEWHLVYTRRTDTLPDHKGQVSFPGGACEISDDGAEDTARRETYEEIGVMPGDIQILGCLDQMLSVTSFLISPVVATIPWPYPFKPSPEEVGRIFTVPLSWLADPANYEERPFFHPVLGGSHLVVYFSPYDGETIWGLTARLTLTLLQTLKLIE